MKFFKNNAYPDVDLHDFRFVIDTVDNNLQFNFPDGFNVINHGIVDKTPTGMIRISDCQIEDLLVYKIKHSNRSGKHRKICEEISSAELNQLFEKGAYLVLFDELYSNDKFIWKCAVEFPDKKSKAYPYIEISGPKDNPLEYYFD